MAFPSTPEALTDFINMVTHDSTAALVETMEERVKMQLREGLLDQVRVKVEEMTGEVQRASEVSQSAVLEATVESRKAAVNALAETES